MSISTDKQALEQNHLSQLNQLMEEAAVKNYLLNSPDFFNKNPELLAHIDLKHQVEDATSLVERQIKVLREKNQALQGQLIEMLHAAYNNENLLIQSNQFMLDLLNKNTLAGLTAAIIQKLKQEFNLDAVSLVLVGNYHNARPAQVYKFPEEIKLLLDCQFPDQQPLCGRLEDKPKKELFGELSSNLQSFALIPLGANCESGLLALASKDIERFEPQMGTLFIELIAKLITHLVKQHEQS